MFLIHLLLKTPTGLLPLLRIGVPAGVRNYARKKTRERLVSGGLFNQLDELEGLGLAVVGSGQSTVDLT